MANQSEMKKELCEWSHSQLKEHFDQLRSIVSEPAFVCTQCGRAANRKKWLCKAKKLATR